MANERPANEMPKWQRSIAGLLGTGLLAVGIYAVLVKANDIGSASLVIVGVGLLMIAVQGTRIVRLGGSTANIELERPAERIVEQAEQEQDPMKAEGLLEAASLIDPAVVRTVQAEGLRYEDLLHDALRQAGLEVERDPVLGGGRVLDFLVELPGDRKVLVEARYRRHGALSKSDVESVLELIETVAGQSLPTIVVTNAPLSPPVLEHNRTGFRNQPPVEVLTWNGEEDTPLLQRAIARTAR